MSREEWNDRPPAIGALLRFAWEDLQRQIGAGLAAAGFDDLGDVPAMGYPPIDGLRPTELAARLRLSKQAVNDVLRRLERRGYVRLEPDPRDGRARLIRLTERGWRMNIDGADLSIAIQKRWAAEIGEERFAQFEATLREIVAIGQRKDTARLR